MPTTTTRPAVSPAPGTAVTAASSSGGNELTTSLSLVDETPTTSGGGGGTDLSQAAIIGGAVGAVAAAALLLFAVLALLYVRSRRQRQLQERAADYLSGRPIAPPSRSGVYSPTTSQQFSTAPVSQQFSATNNTYANIHLTPAGTESSMPYAVTGAATSTSESGRVGMSDALSERNAAARSSRSRKKSHAEPASAPADVPYAQLDPNGERFAKFQSIEN